MELNLKIFRTNRLGIPQERIAKRLGVPKQTISDYLPKMAELPFSVNADLSKGFTVSQVAEKHACPVGPEDRTGGWPEPLAWSVALKDKDDLERFNGGRWHFVTMLLINPTISCPCGE